MRNELLFLAVALLVSCGGSSTRTDGDGTSDAGEAGDGANGGSTTGGSSGNTSGGATQGGSSTGGAGRGGSATAGSPSGGSGGSAGAMSGGGTSGASPTGGASGTSPTGGSAGMSAAECDSVEDCSLSEDCCSCFAAGPGEATQICRQACTPAMNACARENVTAADMACLAGRCVLGRNCDLRNVSCDIPEPECSGGSIPSAIGSCYGPCTIVSECAAVASCAVCEDAGLACVTVDGLHHQCVDTPPACENNPTCACMGVCPPPSYFCSDESSTNLSCYCPTC